MTEGWKSPASIYYALVQYHLNYLYVSFLSNELKDLPGEFNDSALCLNHRQHSINVSFFFQILPQYAFIHFLPLISLFRMRPLPKSHVCLLSSQTDCQGAFTIVSYTQQRLTYTCHCCWCLIMYYFDGRIGGRRTPLILSLSL